MLALTLGLSPGAIGGTTAQFSGTIVDAEGSPVADAEVVVTTAAPPMAVLQTTTDSDGAWSLELPMAGLASRAWYVEAASASHAPARFGGSPDPICYFGCPGTGAVTVTPGEVRNDLHLTLSPGAGLSGRVTENGSDVPLAGATIQIARRHADTAQFFSPQFGGQSGVDGQWQTGLALPSGDYHLTSIPPPGQNLVMMAYGQVVCEYGSCPISATEAVSLKDSATVENVDFAVRPGGRLTGQLFPADEPRRIWLNDASGIRLTSITLQQGQTEWAFDRLAGGSYFLELQPLGLSDLSAQLHNGLPCPRDGCVRARGAALSVPIAGERNGVNLTMATGGRIGGRVLDADSDLPPDIQPGDIPFLSNFVIVDDEGEFYGSGTIEAVEGEVILRAFDAVPPGSYFVHSFYELLGSGLGFDQPGLPLPAFTTLPGYVDSVYPDTPCIGLACATSGGTPVVVEAGAETEITLRVHRGSSIAGSVVDAAETQEIEGAVVELLNLAGERLAAVRTDSTGAFFFGAFPAGSYFLRTAMSAQVGFGIVPDQNAYFDRVHGLDSSCSGLLCDLGAATPIVLDGANDVLDFVFEVEAGPVIRGRVFDALTRASIRRASVEVYDSAGRLVGEYFTNWLTGVYQSTALPPDTYTLIPRASSAYTLLPVTDASPQSLRIGQAEATGIGRTVTVEGSDVDADFLAVDRAANELYRDRFEQAESL